MPKESKLSQFQKFINKKATGVLLSAAWAWYNFPATQEEAMDHLENAYDSVLEMGESLEGFSREIVENNKASIMYELGKVAIDQVTPFLKDWGGSSVEVATQADEYSVVAVDRVASDVAQTFSMACNAITLSIAVTSGSKVFSMFSPLLCGIPGQARAQDMQGLSDVGGDLKNHEFYADLIGHYAGQNNRNSLENAQKAFLDLQKSIKKPGLEELNARVRARKSMVSLCFINGRFDDAATHHNEMMVDLSNVEKFYDPNHYQLVKDNIVVSSKKIVSGITMGHYNRFKELHNEFKDLSHISQSQYHNVLKGYEEAYEMMLQTKELFGKKYTIVGTGSDVPLDLAVLIDMANIQLYIAQGIINDGNSDLGEALLLLDEAKVNLEQSSGVEAIDQANIKGGLEAVKTLRGILKDRNPELFKPEKYERIIRDRNLKKATEVYKSKHGRVPDKDNDMEMGEYISILEQETQKYMQKIGGDNLSNVYQVNDDNYQEFIQDMSGESGDKVLKAGLKKFQSIHGRAPNKDSKKDMDEYMSYSYGLAAEKLDQGEKVNNPWYSKIGYLSAGAAGLVTVGALKFLSREDKETFSAESVSGDKVKLGVTISHDQVLLNLSIQGIDLSGDRKRLLDVNNILVKSLREYGFTFDDKKTFVKLNLREGDNVKLVKKYAYQGKERDTFIEDLDKSVREFLEIQRGRDAREAYRKRILSEENEQEILRRKAEEEKLKEASDKLKLSSSKRDGLLAVIKIAESFLKKYKPRDPESRAAKKAKTFEVKKKEAEIKLEALDPEFKALQDAEDEIRKQNEAAQKARMIEKERKRELYEEKERRLAEQESRMFDNLGNDGTSESEDEKEKVELSDSVPKEPEYSLSPAREEVAFERTPESPRSELLNQLKREGLGLFAIKKGSGARGYKGSKSKKTSQIVAHFGPEQFMADALNYEGVDDKMASRISSYYNLVMDYLLGDNDGQHMAGPSHGRSANSLILEKMYQIGDDLNAVGLFDAKGIMLIAHMLHEEGSIALLVNDNELKGHIATDHQFIMRAQRKEHKDNEKEEEYELEINSDVKKGAITSIKEGYYNSYALNGVIDLVISKKAHQVEFVMLGEDRNIKKSATSFREDIDKEALIMPIHTSASLDAPEAKNHFAGLYVKKVKDENGQIKNIAHYIDLAYVVRDKKDLPMEAKKILVELGIDLDDVVITTNILQPKKEDGLELCNVDCGPFVGFALSELAMGNLVIQKGDIAVLMGDDKLVRVEDLEEYQSDCFGSDLRKRDLSLVEKGHVLQYSSVDMLKLIISSVQQERDGNPSSSVEVRQRSESLGTKNPSLVL